MAAPGRRAPAVAVLTALALLTACAPGNYRPRPTYSYTPLPEAELYRRIAALPHVMKVGISYMDDAVAAYRAARRAAGKDSPRSVRTVAGDGHIPNGWFRAHVWDPALEAAELPYRVTPHGLRHAHASWLLAGGADLQVVKEQLGHGSITTTEKYLQLSPAPGTRHSARWTPSAGPGTSARPLLPSRRARLLPQPISETPNWRRCV